MKDVFISYVTPNLETAELVYGYLTRNGFSCFFAPEDMIGGHPYGEELVHAMKNCRVQLLLYSDMMNVRKKNILAELETAWKYDIPCLCVKLDNSEPNDGIAYYVTSGHTLCINPNRITEYLPKVAESLRSMLPKEKEPEEAAKPVAEVKPVTEFKYIPEYGMMINPADNERNVSFRTNTFINMMAGIYEKVAELSGEKAARDIFFDSGYKSGKNFADRINSQWGHSFSVKEMQEKIRKWCEFDSAVGWGKFEADIRFDENSEIPFGTMTITAPFTVDKHCKCKVCAFIHGYCTGVLDTILDEMDIELECCDCPLEVKARVPKCTFKIQMKG